MLALTQGNTWAALHDPEVYDDPESFVPERFIAHKYGIKASVADAWRNTLPYGAGRRICLGMAVAENSLSINGECTSEREWVSGDEWASWEESESERRESEREMRSARDRG